MTYAVGGSAVDPATVAVKYKDPSGNISAALVYGVDAALVRDEAGTYHTDVSIDEAGTWYVRWYTTGTYQSAVEDDFYVRTSNF